MGSDDSTGARRAPEHEAFGQGAEADVALPNHGATAIRAADPSLTEDLALSLLKRPDVSSGELEQLAKNGNVLKNRKVKLALVEHPKTPRHVSLPLVRQLYTFDLMQVALTPVVPADVKRAADDVLCSKLEAISQGERLTLAHRGSGRIAEALLSDGESRVMQSALQNSRLTESAIVRALARPESNAAFVEAVCQHTQWSVRREVRIALLRNAKTPVARALEFARTLPLALVREILHSSRLQGNIKAHVLAEIENRGSGKSKS
ncbi:MAG TPA: hypothetical protein VLL05_08640 [Terriglobales bacterium]|nr:hypothetical protein [Terriglobales bacterium]